MLGNEAEQTNHTHVAPPMCCHHLLAHTLTKRKQGEHDHSRLAITYQRTAITLKTVHQTCQADSAAHDYAFPFASPRLFKFISSHLIHKNVSPPTRGNNSKPDHQWSGTDNPRHPEGRTSHGLSNFSPHGLHFLQKDSHTAAALSKSARTAKPNPTTPQAVRKPRI